MKGQKDKKLQTNESNSINDIIPIEDIRDGILITKDDYIAFMEVMPINFKLRSEREQNYIIEKYEELLKIMKVPFYISTNVKKADGKAHLDYMQKHLDTEENEQIKAMEREYMDFFKEVAGRNTVSRRFIVSIPYQFIKGVTEVPFIEIKSWLEQNCMAFRDAISDCGNDVIISDSNQFTAQILFEMFSVRRAERERIPRL